MLKKIIYTLSSLFLCIFFVGQDKCNIPYEYVTPRPFPPICWQTGDNVCASSACANVMEYWTKLGDTIVNPWKCEKYQEEFKTEFGTEDGSAILDQKLFESAFRDVVRRNLTQEFRSKNCRNQGLSDCIKTDSMHLISYTGIRKHMKYSLNKDNSSPWDRPGVIVVGSTNVNVTQSNHVVLAYGCARVNNKKKRSLTYYYKVKDLRKEYGTDLRLAKIEVAVLPRNKQKIPRGFFALWWPVKCE